MTEREIAVARLTAVPAMLRELTIDATTAQAIKPPAPGEWGVADVVRHLLEGDREKFLPRLRRMRVETRPVFERTTSREGDTSDLPTLVAAFASASTELHIYPEGSSSVLRTAISEAMGLNPDRIVCGNGSDELLHLLALVYSGPGDEVLYTEHGFLVYKIAALAAGAKPDARDRKGKQERPA